MDALVPWGLEHTITPERGPFGPAEIGCADMPDNDDRQSPANVEPPDTSREVADSTANGPCLRGIVPYIQVLRPDHWLKNVFTVIGALTCIAYLRIEVDSRTVASLVLATLISCVISSVNYAINEFLDAAFDAEHPVKRSRPVPKGLVEAHAVFLLGGILLVGALATAVVTFDNKALIISILLFLLFGLFYNVKPIRAKEIPFVDVIVESVNNPLRLLIGWFAVAPSTRFPPVSLILLFWTFGAFLMSAKRTAELRYLAGGAARYRMTYHYYSERALWIAMGGYALASLALLAWIATCYKPDLLWGSPIALFLICWFFKLTADHDSVVKEPERLFLRPFFVCAMGGFCVFAWLTFR